MGGSWWSVLLGLPAALAMAAMPVQAQSLRGGPPELSYPSQSSYPPRAESDKPADQAARETAAADAADAACKAGDAAGCAALGSAYVLGEGRPQVRPVGDILLRRACTAGSGKGCAELAKLLRTRKDIPVSEPDALADRACTLGVGEACSDLARLLSRSELPEDLKRADALTARACQLGVPAGCVYPPPTPAELERQLLKDCDAGTSDACATLAERLLRNGRSPADQTRGLDLLDRMCRGGDGGACAAAVDRWSAAEAGEGPRTTEYRSLGCTAGNAEACSTLGTAAFKKMPSDRAAALAFFEKACALDFYACRQAKQFRDEPGLRVRCEGGEQAACVDLGVTLSTWGTLMFDQERALAVLSSACKGGALAGCGAAARLLWESASGADVPAKAQAALDLLTRGCDGGDSDSCERLADELERGQFIPRNEERSLALYVPQCDAGREAACDALVRYNHPAAPAPLASGYGPPDRTPEEIAAEMQAQEDERERQIARIQANICKSATAQFEGATYTDTLCSNAAASIGGFPVPELAGAPWQALLWRPAKLGSLAVAPEYRAECGGSVIATGWILTAAHCLVDDVEGVGDFPIEKHGYQVRLGVIRPLEPEGNAYPITRLIPHPLFKRSTLEFDIALVQYDPKRGVRGPFSAGTARIKLDTRSLEERPVEPRLPVYSFGWGRTAIDRPQAAEVLQGVRLELRSAAECTAATGWTDTRRDSVLCAAGAKGEQACFGDSGGPLITYRDEKGVPVQIGVVSGGIKCGTTGKPSRYTRIGHPLVQAWLASHVPGFRSGQTAR